MSKAAGPDGLHSVPEHKLGTCAAFPECSFLLLLISCIVPKTSSLIPSKIQTHTAAGARRLRCGAMCPSMDCRREDVHTEALFPSHRWISSLMEVKWEIPYEQEHDTPIT